MANQYKEVIVFLLNNNNEVLFLKKSKEEKHNANKWAPLAGHIEDFDKTVENAAIREIKEELSETKWYNINEIIKMIKNEDEKIVCSKRFLKVLAIIGKKFI